MKNTKLNLEIALQDGMTAKVENGKVIIEIDKNITKRDLWAGQIEMWLSEENSNKSISSGYLRISHKNKLLYKNWR